MKPIWTIVTVLAIVVIAWFALSNPLSQAQTDTKSDTLAVAEWLTDSGAKLYGAFWCSACNYQKELFGDAAPSLPYIESSTPDGKAQSEAAKTAGIKAYPTWIFIDGTRHEGVLSINALKERSNYQGPIIGASFDD